MKYTEACLPSRKDGEGREDGAGWSWAERMRGGPDVKTPLEDPSCNY